MSTLTFATNDDKDFSCVDDVDDVTVGRSVVGVVGVVDGGSAVVEVVLVGVDEVNNDDEEATVVVVVVVDVVRATVVVVTSH